MGDQQNQGSPINFYSNMNADFNKAFSSPASRNVGESTAGVLREPSLAKEAGQGLLSHVSSYAQGDMGGMASATTGIPANTKVGETMESTRHRSTQGMVRRAHLNRRMSGRIRSSNSIAELPRVNQTCNPTLDTRTRDIQKYSTRLKIRHPLSCISSQPPAQSTAWERSRFSLFS
jgi:hypothetical protein